VWAAHVAPWGLRSCSTQALRCLWQRLIMRRPGCGRRAAAVAEPAPAAGRARRQQGRDAAACAAGTGAGGVRDAGARRGHPDAGGRHSNEPARDGRGGRRAAAADERRRSEQGRAAVAGGWRQVHWRAPLRPLSDPLPATRAGAFQFLLLSTPTLPPNVRSSASAFRLAHQVYRR